MSKLIRPLLYTHPPVWDAPSLVMLTPFSNLQVSFNSPLLRARVPTKLDCDPKGQKPKDG